MNFTTFTMFLPFLGVVYGTFLGMYIRSDKKTSKNKIALIISGILIVLVCAFVLVKAYSLR